MIDFLITFFSLLISFFSVHFQSFQAEKMKPQICTLAEIQQTLGFVFDEELPDPPRIYSVPLCDKTSIIVEIWSAYADKEWRLFERRTKNKFELVQWNAGGYLIPGDGGNTVTVEECLQIENCDFYGLIFLSQVSENGKHMIPDKVLAWLDIRSKTPTKLEVTNDDLLKINENLTSGKLFYHQNGQQKIYKQTTPYQN